jgi:hypothetical protein
MFSYTTTQRTRPSLESYTSINDNNRGVDVREPSRFSARLTLLPNEAR